MSRLCRARAMNWSRSVGCTSPPMRTTTIAKRGRTGDLRGAGRLANPQTDLSCPLFHLRVHRLRPGPAHRRLHGPPLLELGVFTYAGAVEGWAWTSICVLGFNG